MARIEEFTHDGKNFIYLDISGFKTNDEFIQFIEESKPIIAKYAEQSLHTITNITDVRFDTRTKELATEWMTHNKPYVKFGAVVGMSGIKKIIVNTIFTLSGRKNMNAASTKKEAIEWLLRQK